jgi:hypothetical protein
VTAAAAGVIAFHPVAASASPNFMTLVVKHAVPVPLQPVADTAVYDEVEKLAEASSLYFRVNPVVPTATARQPACVPGTKFLLYSEVVLLYDLSSAGGGSLSVRVSVAPCSSAQPTLRGEATKRVAGPDDAGAAMASVVSQAFHDLAERISSRPDVARELGLSR